MAAVAPDHPWPLVLLAEVRVRSGNKRGALKAIELAVQRGLKRPESLTEDPELQPLASDPQFQQIVQRLSTKYAFLASRAASEGSLLPMLSLNSIVGIGIP